MTSATQAIQQISDPLIVEHPADAYVIRNEPATLNCKAEGRPPPVISWYRDGQLITTSTENPISHRMILPSGQLLIMKVHSKNKSDVGEYYCNATNPETRVSSISRRARLEVAVIKDDFRESPGDQDEAVGATAVLRCVPPHGEPEPEIRWEKNRKRLALDDDDRVRVDQHGSLHIDEAQKEDSGTYQCIAFNIAGERESRPAQLTIKQKPVIVNGPKNSVIMENGDVLFQCQAIGDPELVGSWTKREGPILTERSTIFGDRSLQIRNAQVSDEGTYVCRMENSVGWQEAEAKLTVHSRPSLVVAPRDKVVSLGRRVSIRCEMAGNPAPGIFWSRVSNQTLLLPNKPYERFRVTEEGTLIIEAVRSEDAGEYACHGLNIAGSAYAKAQLDIKDVDPRPPPIIDIGPQNQTLPSSENALLPCTASGEPAPGISWLKNGVTLSLEEPRFTIVASGTLQISNLQTSDSGLYTCKAVSETGETTWTAALVVEPSTNTQIIFQRNQLLTTFPGHPSKPLVSEVQETSLRLSWKANSYTGTSVVTCYLVEYFSHEMGEGWVVMFDCVRDTSVLVRNLQPNTSYMFLVRARNSHGLSSPSPVSSPTRTKGASSIVVRPTPPLLDLGVVAEKLALPIVRLWNPEVLSSTAIKLTWEVQRNQRFIEGFYVNYWVVADKEDGTSNLVVGQIEPITETIQPSTASICILSGLQKYALYEIRLQPFYSTVKGAESNAVRARTLEDAPSGPPRNIRTSLLDNNTLVMSWEPPARQLQNGILLGFKIYVFGNESKFDHEIQVNSTVESAVIPNVLKEIFYKLYMTAYNTIGEGVKSEVINIGQIPGEVNQPLLMEPWFIALLVATVGAALWLALCVFSIWMYRRRTEHKKEKKNRAVTAPVHRTEENIRTGTIPNQIPLLAANNGDQGCRSNQACMPPGCYDNKSPSDGESKVNSSQSVLSHTYQTLDSLPRAAGMEASNHHEFPFVDGSYSAALPLPPLLKNVYGRGMPLLPYATATLMGNGSGSYHRKMSTGGSIPNPEAYMIQPTGTCVGITKREADHKTDYDEQLRSCAANQPSMFKHPAMDHLSQSLTNAYQSNRSMPANGGSISNQNDYSYGLPTMCSDCDQREYDIPCDRVSSLDSHASMTQFSNGYHDAPLFLPDPMLLNYVAYDSVCADEKTPGFSDLDCHSLASSDEPELSFPNAISKVADFPVLTTGSNGVQFPEGKDCQKVKKGTRHRQRAPRPSSPCSTNSTNSSYGAAPRRPYPKSERKKHLQERTTRAGSSSAFDQSQALAHNNNRRYHDLEDHMNHHLSSIPYSTANSASTRSRIGNFGTSSGCSRGGGGDIERGIHRTMSNQTNTTSTQPSLLLAFDARNKPIV